MVTNLDKIRSSNSPPSHNLKRESKIQNCDDGLEQIKENKGRRLSLHNNVDVVVIVKGIVKLYNVLVP